MVREERREKREERREKREERREKREGRPLVCLKGLERNTPSLHKKIDLGPSGPAYHEHPSRKDPSTEQHSVCRKT